MKFITKFINDSTVEVHVPIMREANHRWMCLPPRPHRLNTHDFLNRDEKDLYARYDLIRFVRDENAKLGYRVETHIRDGWKEPKNPGLTLVVENFKGTTNCQISTPEWGIPAPLGIRLVFYDVSPYSHIAETAKIEITEEEVFIVPDPYSISGYRDEHRGGGALKTKRPIEELIKIKQAREGRHPTPLSFESEEEIKEYYLKQKKK